MHKSMSLNNKLNDRYSIRSSGLNRFFFVSADQWHFSAIYSTSISSSPCDSYNFQSCILPLLLYVMIETLSTIMHSFITRTCIPFIHRFSHISPLYHFSYFIHSFVHSFIHMPFQWFMEIKKKETFVKGYVMGTGVANEVLCSNIM